MANKAVHHEYEIDGQPIPFLIYKEWRKSVRFALGKKGVLIRLPRYYTNTQVSSEIQKAVDWVASVKLKKPDILGRYLSRRYQTGDLVEIHGHTYTIHLEDIRGDQKYSRARLINRMIHIKLAEDDPVLQPKTISTLLSRVVSQDNLPRIKRRVDELNHLHFKKPIKDVRLKYNTSNWGSCSTQGNINLSSRLLFAPLEVQDYVIIHELAHLIEHNHSSRFWNLVADAMPDYKEKERWLKVNGNLCNY